jgi:hypothetical protein
VVSIVSFVIAQSMENLQVVSKHLERKCEIEVIIEQETTPKNVQRSSE